MNFSDETLQAVRQAATPGGAAGLWWAAQVRCGSGYEASEVLQKDLDRLALVIQEEVDLLLSVGQSRVSLQVNYFEEGLLAELALRAELPGYLAFGSKADMWVRSYEIAVRLGGHRGLFEIIWRRPE